MNGFVGFAARDALLYPRGMRLPAAVVASVALSASLGGAACKREAPPLKPDEVPATSTRASASKAAPSAVGTAKRSPIVRLSLGHARACALQADGRVVCWGDAHVFGEHAPPVEPRRVPGLDDAIELAVSDGYGCARRRGGEVVCWDDDDKPPKPVSVGVAHARQLARGVALLEDGHVVEIEMLPAPPHAKPVAGLADVAAISHDSTGTHCAIGKDATTRCWGSSNWGQIPDGTATERPTPVRVKALDGADEISIAYFYGGCARFGGKMKCWGGEWRKAGSKLEEVSGIVDAVEIAVEEYHACARLGGGTVACFGANDAFQVDDGADAGTAAPRPLMGLTDAIGIALGGGEPCGGCGSTCVATKGGDAWCVGVIATGFGAYAWKPTKIDLTLP